MTGRLRFPSTGDLAPEAGAAEVRRVRAAQAVFGKRAHPPQCEPLTGKEQLSIISAELNRLFAQQGDSVPPFAVLSLQNERYALRVVGVAGLAAVIEFEEKTGHFVLFEGGAGDAVFMTTLQGRLIDYIVSLTTAAPFEPTSRIATPALSTSAGPSVAAVDDGLLMSTLLKFQGNCRRAALALGLDDAALQARLQRYFRTRWRSSDRSERRP